MAENAGSTPARPTDRRAPRGVRGYFEWRRKVDDLEHAIWMLSKSGMTLTVEPSDRSGLVRLTVEDDGRSGCTLCEPGELAKSARSLAETLVLGRGEGDTLREMLIDEKGEK